MAVLRLQNTAHDFSGHHAASHEREFENHSEESVLELRRELGHKMITCRIKLGFLGVSRVKNPLANARDSGLSIGQEDALEKKVATHSSVLAWRILWTNRTWWATVHGVTKESDMTEQLNYSLMNSLVEMQSWKQL